jgi:hypothetical protein
MLINKYIDLVHIGMSINWESEQVRVDQNVANGCSFCSYDCGMSHGNAT